MRKLGWMLLGAMGCGGAAPIAQPAKTAPTNAAQQAAAMLPARGEVIARGEGLLPAGLYFRSFQNYDPCHYYDDGQERGLCTVPTHAVIAHEVYEDIHAARAAWPAIPAAAHSAGYPLVAAADQLGMSDPRAGIVVVLGLFADEAKARAWQGIMATSIPADVVELLSDDALVESFKAEPTVMATRIAPGAPATVFKGTFEAPLEDESGEALEPIEMPPPERGREPLCEIHAGMPVLAERDKMMGSYYQWLPVTCDDGQKGWVQWSSTLMGATVTRVPGTDTFELLRVVGAQCDMASWEVREWRPDGTLGTLIAGGGDGPAPC